MATTNGHRNVIKTLGEGFGLDGWMEAEEEFSRRLVTPQPEGTLTVEQYGKKHNISLSHAQNKLTKMYRAGFYGRKKWNKCMVYFVKPKKEWPRATSK